MKLVSYRADHEHRTGLIVPGGLVDLNHSNDQLPSDMKQLIARWPELADLVVRLERDPPEVVSGSVELAPPLTEPGKILCIGLNYADHAAETGADVPSLPVVFSKFPSALTAHLAPIQLPEISHKVDYEAELVVVIGRQGKQIAQDEAMSYVFGYCCGHDVSARDWQKGRPGGQWLLGKTFDTFAPLGPEIVTADEVGDPGNLDVCLRLNGKIMQQSNTSQFIFSVPELISHLSQFCTLEPGDLLFTGTPPGVGTARTPPVYLKPGDVVEVEIQRLGILRNPVVAG